MLLLLTKVFTSLIKLFAVGCKYSIVVNDILELVIEFCWTSMIMLCTITHCKTNILTSFLSARLQSSYLGPVVWVPVSRVPSADVGFNRSTSVRSPSGTVLPLNGSRVITKQLLCFDNRQNLYVRCSLTRAASMIIFKISSDWLWLTFNQN